jgi:hypothetical protein
VGVTTTRPNVLPPRSARPVSIDGGFGSPPPPRAARNVAAALLGVLLIVLCAAGVAVYTSRVSHRHAVLVIARPVKAGAVIQSADVREARLAADRGIETVPAGQRDRIIGRMASANLAAGTLITHDEVGTGPQADADHAIVGLALKAGQYPGGLRPLDRVMLVDAGSGAGAQAASAPAGANPNVLVNDAQVTSVDSAADGQTTVVSVLVPVRLAPAVAAASAHGAISVILVGGPASG